MTVAAVLVSFAASPASAVMTDQADIGPTARGPVTGLEHFRVAEALAVHARQLSDPLSFGETAVPAEVSQACPGQRAVAAL